MRNINTPRQNVLFMHAAPCKTFRRGRHSIYVTGHMWCESCKKIRTGDRGKRGETSKTNNAHFKRTQWAQATKTNIPSLSRLQCCEGDDDRATGLLERVVQGGNELASVGRERRQDERDVERRNSRAVAEDSEHVHHGICRNKRHHRRQKHVRVALRNPSWRTSLFTAHG